MLARAVKRTEEARLKGTKVVVGRRKLLKATRKHLAIIDLSFASRSYLLAVLGSTPGIILVNHAHTLCIPALAPIVVHESLESLVSAELTITCSVDQSDSDKSVPTLIFFS